MSIPVNFSISRKAVEFIYTERAADTQNRFIRFARRELVTRITGITLSILLVLDFSIHSAGVINSGFFAIYKGLVERKPINFSLSLKHLKCLKLFISSFPMASLIGLIFPDIKSFSTLENRSIGSIRALLLSRDSIQYPKTCVLDSGDFLEYISSLSNKMNPAEKEGMKESLELLKKTRDLSKMFRRNKLYSNDPLRLNSICSFLLIKSIKSLTKMDSSLLKRILFKECLSRVLAMGFPLAAALDLFMCLVLESIFYISDIIFDLLAGNTIFGGDFKAMMLYLFDHFRDVVLSIFGKMAASAVGVISPTLGCKMANIHGKFYDKVRFSSRDISKTILDNTRNLHEGADLLIPITLWGIEHYVTFLVSKEKDNYSVTLLNKGLDSDFSTNIVTGNRFIKDDVISANLTVNNIALVDLEKYLSLLINTVCLSSYKINKKAREYQSEAVKEMYKDPGNNEKKKRAELPLIYFKRLVYQRAYLEIFLGVHKLAREKSELLCCKTQKTGDCCKASTLAALHYHSRKKNGDAKPYKTYLHNIKKMALKNDGHLLDIALASPLTKEKPSSAAKDRIEKKRNRAPGEV